MPALVLLLVTERGFKLRVVWKSVVRMIKDSKLLWTRPAATLPFDAIVGEFGRWSALIARLPNELDRLIPHGTTCIVRFLCEQIHSIFVCMRWTFLLGEFFLSTNYVDILPRNQFDDTEIINIQGGKMFLCLKAIRLKIAFFKSRGEPSFVSAFSRQPWIVVCS